MDSIFSNKIDKKEETDEVKDLKLQRMIGRAFGSFLEAAVNSAFLQDDLFDMACTRVTADLGLDRLGITVLRQNRQLNGFSYEPQGISNLYEIFGITRSAGFELVDFLEGQLMCKFHHLITKKMSQPQIENFEEHVDLFTSDFYVGKFLEYVKLSNIGSQYEEELTRGYLKMVSAKYFVGCALFDTTYLHRVNNFLRKYAKGRRLSDPMFSGLNDFFKKKLTVKAIPKIPTSINLKKEHYFDFVQAGVSLDVSIIPLESIEQATQYETAFMGYVGGQTRTLDEMSVDGRSITDGYYLADQLKLNTQKRVVEQFAAFGANERYPIKEAYNEYGEYTRMHRNIHNTLIEDVGDYWKCIRSGELIEIIGATLGDMSGKMATKHTFEDSIDDFLKKSLEFMTIQIKNYNRYQIYYFETKMMFELYARMMTGEFWEKLVFKETEFLDVLCNYIDSRIKDWTAIGSICTFKQSCSKLLDEHWTIRESRNSSINTIKKEILYFLRKLNEYFGRISNVLITLLIELQEIIEVHTADDCCWIKDNVSSWTKKMPIESNEFGHFLMLLCDNTLNFSYGNFPPLETNKDQFKKSFSRVMSVDFGQIKRYVARRSNKFHKQMDHPHIKVKFMKFYHYNNNCASELPMVSFSPDFIVYYMHWVQNLLGFEPFPIDGIRTKTGIGNNLICTMETTIGIQLGKGLIFPLPVIVWGDYDLNTTSRPWRNMENELSKQLMFITELIYKQRIVPNTHNSKKIRETTSDWGYETTIDHKYDRNYDINSPGYKYYEENYFSYGDDTVVQKKTKSIIKKLTFEKPWINSIHEPSHDHFFGTHRFYGLPNYVSVASKMFDDFYGYLVEFLEEPDNIKEFWTLHPDHRHEM